MDSYELGDELEPEVSERLEGVMAPIEEAERQRLTVQAEEEVADRITRLRDELEAQGVDGVELKDQLREAAADLRADKTREINEELRLRLAPERRSQLAQILEEVADERSDV
jgi:hypothetical protein